MTPSYAFSDDLELMVNHQRKEGQCQGDLGGAVRDIGASTAGYPLDFASNSSIGSMLCCVQFVLFLWFSLCQRHRQWRWCFPCPYRVWDCFLGILLLCQVNRCCRLKVFSFECYCQSCKGITCLDRSSLSKLELEGSDLSGCLLVGVGCYQQVVNVQDCHH